ncbi:CD109 antigen-like [Rhinatrema bivittatum]|uniref:CD109 antigen-like n=1 Tax=Rhinatrema bivittatum TaxID=194408 RepID=UPI00112797DC|nr:CD109 antigen-like [Rhinatrema bivittatum]
MQPLWARLLEQCLLILLLSCACAASPSYYITVPNLLRPGTNSSLAVHWFGANHSEINVTATVLSGVKPLVQAQGTFKNETIGILTLPALPVDSFTSIYTLNVTGSVRNELLFSHDIFVNPLESISVFIQTDKLLYWPGQGVKIRAICIYQDLRPFHGQIDIYVRGPSYNLVQQWLNVMTDMGVVAKEFLLSDNTPLGEWTITVNTQERVTTSTFTVAEFALSRFEVTVASPYVYIAPKQGDVTGTVTAKYTSGEKVKGNVTITLRQGSFYIPEDIVLNKTYEISGAVNFSFNHKEMNSILQQYFTVGTAEVGWFVVNITATVTEALTGITVNQTHPLIITDSEYTITIQETSPLRPPFNYTGKVIISRQDFQPLTKEDRNKTLTMHIIQFNESYSLSRSSAYGVGTADVQEYTVPENGVINIQIPVKETTRSITLEVHYQNATESFHAIDQWSWATDYIFLRVPDSIIEVGSSFELFVETSQSIKEINYVVSAIGMVVAAGKKNAPAFTLTPESSWAPMAIITVYFIQENGEVIRNSRTVAIKDFFTNQVSLSWSKKEAKPAENVTLSIHVTESNSLVGLLVVDKRERLWRNRDITASVVQNDLIRNYNQERRMIVLTDASFYIREGIPHYPFDILPVTESDAFSQFGLLNMGTNFPDTWIWAETNTGSATSTNLQVTVPHSIATFVASAFVVSERLGLGLTSEPAEIEVFHPLFISLNLPFSVVRGEQFIAEVILFNNLASMLEVLVKLDQSDSFSIIIPSNNTNTVPNEKRAVLPAQDGTTLFFPIKPKLLGKIPITIRVTSPTAFDDVTKTVSIRVRAEGIQQFYSQSVLLEATGNVSQTITKNVSFAFPNNVVNGSEQAYITAIGDIFGPSIKGLESLIQMPYGCGEQNMINFAPSIYVLKYLSLTNQTNQHIMNMAIGFMEQGYQRELTYMRSEGSFSAFGNNDQFGSTWLSAFVIRCFLQAKPIIFIDSTIISRTMQWLIGFQDMNTGQFTEPGRVIHSELQGGQNGPITLTAYIVAVILEDAVCRNMYASQVTKAIQFLEGKLAQGIDSNYTLSIVTYALSLANSTQASLALNQLNGRAETNAETKFWSSPTTGLSNYWQPRSSDIETAAYGLLSHFQQIVINEVKCVPIFRNNCHSTGEWICYCSAETKFWSSPTTGLSNYWQPRSSDIETAAYGLLSHFQQNRINEGIPILKWLSQQRSHLGGYSSTQDTIMALQAMSQFASRYSVGNTGLTISVTGPGSTLQTTFQINSQNLLVLQSHQLNVFQSFAITVTAQGNGFAIVQVSVCFPETKMTLLSAFVIRCFLQAKPIIFIDSTIISRTMQWLIGFQDMNTGQFTEPGRVIHSELQGGQNGPITLTAYIVAVILEDAVCRNMYASQVTKAIQFLEGKLAQGIDSNYTLSIVTYALSLANSTQASLALNQLNGRAETNAETKFWSSPTTGLSNYWQPRSSDIETAAYGLLSHFQQNRINEGIPILKWLSQQRSHLGGYSSTQDTIMALQAMSQFASRYSVGNTGLTISVTGPGSTLQTTFQINSQNLLVLQSHQLNVFQSFAITVTAQGNGFAIVQFNIAYNIIPEARHRRNSDKTEAFELDVIVKDNKNDIDRITIRICTRYRGSVYGNQSGMALLEVGFLSGFQLNQYGIAENEPIKKVEPENDKVNLYFDSINGTQICVEIPMVRASRVAGGQDAVVSIIDYYEPRRKATRLYSSQIMNSISSCDFCGPDCSLCKSNVAVLDAVTTNASPALAPHLGPLLLSMLPAVLLCYFH